MDDAICLEDRGSEGSVLWVVIADPTRFIDPDSPLFHEALRRQTSMYLPTGRPLHNTAHQDNNPSALSIPKPALLTLLFPPPSVLCPF